MAEVIIAAGSNLGDRREMLSRAGVFLQSLSNKPIETSSIWESEPVGPAEFSFYNSLAIIQSSLPPDELLKRLKEFEVACGRDRSPQRWGPRELDLDIIAYDNLVIHRENLIIPHPEYRKRLFVLLPLQELRPQWQDPEENTTILQLVNAAPPLRIRKTREAW